MATMIDPTTLGAPATMAGFADTGYNYTPANTQPTVQPQNNFVYEPPPATMAPFADTSNRYPTPVTTTPQGLGRATTKAKGLEDKYKWLEKVPEYNKLSAEDKQQVVDTVKKLSPRQQSQMASQYGAYIGVFKPYNEWDNTDILSMYAQATGKTDINEAKKEFIKQYSHGFNNWLEESGVTPKIPTAWGYSDRAFNVAVKNFRSLQEGNTNPRLVRTAEGWYDTVTGTAFNQPGAKAGYVETATGFSVPYNANLPISPELQANIEQYPDYAADITLEEATATPAPTDPKEIANQQVKDYYNKYLNRDPSAKELSDWSSRILGGENVSTQIANLPEASSAGTRPTYGGALGGATLPTTPNISGIAQPDIPKLINYGQTAGGLSMPVYGNTTQGGLGLAQYGDKVGGYTPVTYGDTIAGLNLVKTGDTVGGVSPVQYGSKIGGLAPANYGDVLDNNIGLSRYGATVAGQNVPDYDQIVKNPAEAWRFENTDAYNAKNIIMNQTLQNQLAARGALRGAPAVNMITDQTRKLYSEEYNKERDWFINQKTNEYAAKGLAYKDAYTAATNEYNSAFGARTSAYNTALTTEQQRYQDALNNAQSQYTLAYNAQTGQYETVLKNAQELYGLGYGADVSNYTTALYSMNANAGQIYNMQTGQYGNRVQNALTDYNLGTERYDKAYNAAMTQANAAYNELLDAAKLGQSAASTTAQVGTNTANAGSASIQQQGSAAAANAINKGQAEAGLWQGLGNIIPSGLSMYGDIKSLTGGGSGVGGAGGSTNYLGNFSSGNYTLGSGAGRSVSPFSKGLGAVPTTLPKSKAKTYDPNQSYGFNA